MGKEKEEGYRSAVYLYTEDRDSTTGMVIHKKLVELKGQEKTADLLKMAKKEFKEIN